MKSIRQIARAEFISFLTKHRCSLIYGNFTFPFMDNERICEPLGVFDPQYLEDEDFKTVTDLEAEGILFSDNSSVEWNRKDGRYEYYMYLKNVCFQKFISADQKFISADEHSEECIITMYYCE